MPVAPTPIDALPETPSTSDPANFDTEGDAFLGALPTLRSQFNTEAGKVYTNAVEAADAATTASAASTTAQAAQTLVVAASGYFATSASSLSVTAGTKTVVLVESGKAFAAGDAIAIVRKSDPETRMYGSIDTGGVSGQTLTVSVASDGLVGSGGPFTDWMVIHTAFLQAGASAAELRELASAYAAVTPKSMKDAMAEVALTDGTTITPDFNAGINFGVTLGGNRTLANPSNLKVGQSGFIRVTQDGTGSRTLAFGSYWKRPGGAPTLTTTAGAKDIIVYEVISSTEILYGLAKNPSA